MVINKIVTLLTLALLVVPTAWADSKIPASFDHGRWDKLLSTYVHPVNGGKATMVDYQRLKSDQQSLKQYLTALSKVTDTQFDQWSKRDQLAFLINAYNASTVDLILTAWPHIKSIKELGGIFSSPWSKKFVSLLGETRTLDDIEHKLIRGSGRYNDPRVHFAVNCASIGCPALRAEAYVGDKLDQQLDDQTSLFLADRTRNRVDGDVIKLSSIFKWYREDFEKGWHGYYRLDDFLLAHSEDLGLSNTMVIKLKNGDAEIEFLNYDWHLNKQ